jgi:hypothetical protein
MNVSLLPYINSTNSLSSPLADIINVFIFPILFGSTVFLKIISIIVLSKIIKKNKKNNQENNNKMFYYIITYEAFDLVAASQSCLLALFNCGVYCPYAYDYLTNLFAVISIGILNHVILQVQTYIEIAFSIFR